MLSRQLGTRNKDCGFSPTEVFLVLDFPILGSLNYVELLSRDMFSIFGIVHKVLAAEI